LIETFEALGANDVLYAAVMTEDGVEVAVANTNGSVRVERSDLVSLSLKY